MVSHPETGSDSPIRSDRDRGRDRFYQCWERFMETISACPHHGFDTWMLVNHFYGGMSPGMKQLLETMCGGDFLSKHPDEAKGWDEPTPREVEKMRPSTHQRGGFFHFQKTWK